MDIEEIPIFFKATVDGVDEPLIIENNRSTPETEIQPQQSTQTILELESNIDKVVSNT